MAPIDPATVTMATSQPASPGGDPIVHLIIRKSAKLDWRLAGSRVELAISADASGEHPRCLAYSVS